MRAVEFFREAIAAMPRNLPLYLANRIKLLDRIIAVVPPALETIKHADSDGEYLVRYALGHANDGDRPPLPSSYEVDLDRHYELRSLQDNLAAIKQFGARDFLKYTIGTLDRIRPLSDSTRATLALMPHTEAGLREYGYDPDDPKTQDDAEYQSAQRLIQAYLTIWQCLGQVERLIADLRPRLNDITKRHRHQFDPDKYRPDHEPVETLYHASMFATEIMRDGFAAERPVERRGVGYIGGAGNLISFTHSLPVAHDILRMLRDIWLIVHGQLTRQQILRWIADEGMDAGKVGSYFMASREPVDTLAQVLRLYQGWIGLSKLRTDPVIVRPEDLIPTMQHRRFNDIGIVACSVRLDDGATYHHGEAEFRVPASHVVGPIRRVL